MPCSHKLVTAGKYWEVSCHSYASSYAPDMYNRFICKAEKSSLAKQKFVLFLGFVSPLIDLKL